MSEASADILDNPAPLALARLRVDLAGRAKGLIGWLAPALLLAAWQASASLGWLPDFVLPSPLAVLSAAARLSASGELARNVEVSFLRAISGLAVGGGIGFALGLANGLSSLSEKLTDTTLQMARNVPHLALIPLVILWFGIDEGAKLFLVALGVFFPIYVNTMHGVRTVDPQLVEMARSYGMRGSNCSGASSCRARCLRSSSGCAMGSA